MLLIMECILEANPSPDIRWYRGDTLIEESSSRHKMARKNTGRDQYTLTLTIRAPTQEDGGQYRCNAVNAYGESNANIALNFAGKILQTRVYSITKKKLCTLKYKTELLINKLKVLSWVSYKVQYLGEYKTLQTYIINYENLNLVVVVL